MHIMSTNTRITVVSMEQYYSNPIRTFVPEEDRGENWKLTEGFPHLQK